MRMLLSFLGVLWGWSSEVGEATRPPYKAANYNPHCEYTQNGTPNFLGGFQLAAGAS